MSVRDDLVRSDFRDLVRHDQRWRALYMRSPEFHQTIDMVAGAISTILDAIAKSAEETERARALAIAAINLGPLTPVGAGPICPDCAAGKCGVCGKQALDPATDLIVDCACPHGGSS